MESILIVTAAVVTIVVGVQQIARVLTIGWRKRKHKLKSAERATPKPKTQQ